MSRPGARSARRIDANTIVSRNNRIGDLLMFLTKAWHRMIRPASRRVSGRQRSGRRPASRLCLEALEDRCLLSSYTITDLGTLGGGPSATLTPGPLVLLSDPDPLANCPSGTLGADVAGEPYVVVN